MLGNITLYRQTGTMAWPSMVVWGLRVLHGAPALELTCARAANASDGSRAPEEIDGNDDNSGWHHKSSFTNLKMMAVVT